MAVDIPDWTSAVTVQSGSITILGTANVNVANTPAVTISGTPSVTVSSGTVNIGNTPSVTISGTPVVILGGGTASIGSISAIGSTVTIAGTVNIGNTPSVSITGTPTVNIGNTPSVTLSGTAQVNIASQSAALSITFASTQNVNIANTPAVTISSGTVSITGTPNVNIASQTGNLTVVFAATQNVNIANTPAVTISSGTVSITGTPNINIQSQTVNLNTQQPQTLLGNFVVPANGVNHADYVLPAGCHAVGLAVVGTGVDILTVLGLTSGVTYLGVNGQAGSPVSGYFVAPVLQILEGSVRVSGDTTFSPTGPATIYAVAILDAEGVFIFDNQREPVASYLTDPTGAPLATSGSIHSLVVMTHPANLPLAVEVAPQVATYSMGDITAAAPVAACNTLYALQNPAGSGKILELVRFRAEGVRTTAAILAVTLFKRASLETGGTSTSLAANIAAHDSTNPASVCVPRKYTANPTGGGAPATVLRTERMFNQPAATSPNDNQAVVFLFPPTDGQPVRIRPGECVTFDLGGSTVAGGSFIWEAEWREVAP